MLLDLVLQKIAERKIQEAMEKGELDNLPGKGKPLQLDDLPGVPAEEKMAYRLLKNSGFAPPEILLKQEINELKELIKQCRNSKEHKILQDKLLVQEIKYNILMEKRGLR